MAALSLGIATSTIVTVRTRPITRTTPRPRISCIGFVTFFKILLFRFHFLLLFVSFKFFYNIVMRRKDPEGLFGPPQTGHIARREFKRRLERDAELREALEQQAHEEKERRRALRRVILYTELSLLRVCNYDYSCFL